MKHSLKKKSRAYFIATAIATTSTQQTALVWGGGPSRVSQDPEMLDRREIIIVIRNSFINSELTCQTFNEFYSMDNRTFRLKKWL